MPIRAVLIVVMSTSPPATFGSSMTMEVSSSVRFSALAENSTTLSVESSLIAATAAGRPMAAEGATLPPAMRTAKSTESLRELSLVSGSSPPSGTVLAGGLDPAQVVVIVPEGGASQPPGTDTCRPAQIASTFRRKRSVLLGGDLTREGG